MHNERPGESIIFNFKLVQAFFFEEKRYVTLICEYFLSIIAIYIYMLILKNLLQCPPKWSHDLSNKYVIKFVPKSIFDTKLS